MTASEAERFRNWFHQATGSSPYHYQTRLATDYEGGLPSLLHVPTGLGKTAAAVLAWLWRRREAPPEVRAQTPRRLVYCLPMRVLVEQTRDNATLWLHRLDLLGGVAQTVGSGAEERVRDYTPSWSDPNRIAVSVLMGGEDDGEWDLHPERDAILIGTQDMLLSRALNRGYAMSRYRWPVHFGLLNNDCLWVADEVQLMGSGLATSAQMEAFQGKLWSPLIPCQFIWMSATLGTGNLRTRDREDWGMAEPPARSLCEDDKRQAEQRLRAEKGIQLTSGPPKTRSRGASGILDHHVPGRISLIVVNTVDVAQGIYRELEKAGRGSKSHTDPGNPLLLHSRFRPFDRRATLDCLLEFAARQDPLTGVVSDHPGIVLVSTQVVEAGLDISAARLWSEVAPWPSVVQRLGRVNREGRQPEACAIFWMPKRGGKKESDKGNPNAKRIGPYEKRGLEGSKQLLEEVCGYIRNGKAYRDALDEVLATEESRSAFKVEPDAVIRPHDLCGLFSTEPDLAGGFTDVSLFVRDQDRNADAYVFWREFDARPPDDEPSPERDELCPVPFYDLQRFLDKKARAWEWNFEAARWEPRRANEVFPGMTLLLGRSQGGYSDALGWTGSSEDKPTVIFEQAEAAASQGQGGRLDALDFDPTSEGSEWVPLSAHLAAVEQEARRLIGTLGLAETAEGAAVITAARWHDWGKSLDRWQAAVESHVARVVVKCNDVLADENLKRFHGVAEGVRARLVQASAGGAPWGKWPDVRHTWSHEHWSADDRKHLRKLLYTPFSPKLRHEAASALAAWQAWRRGDRAVTALAVYLAASHHGKVRTVLRSANVRDEVFGLRPGDRLEPVPGHFTESPILDFTPRLVGTPGSWGEDAETFTFADPTWTAMIAELLGPATSEAIRDSEPRSLGPFKLAYLEAVLRAGDALASGAEREKAGER